MKVVTLNTWGKRGPPERRPVLVKALQELNADLFCLQEVTDPSLLEVFPHPTRLHAPEGGLAIVTRLPVQHHRVVTYRTVSPVEPYRRQVLIAELHRGTDPLWVANTHLAWKAEDEVTRLAQVAELSEIAASLKTPILLSGDFNAAPDQPSISRLRQAGFVDLFEEAHPQESGVTWDNRNPFIQSHSVRFPDRRIDYLLLKQDRPLFVLSGCEIVCRIPTPEGLYPSDHYGVLATFRQ